MLRTIFRNAGVLLAGKSFNAILSLAYTALTARALGIEGFGLLVLIHAFAQMIGEIVNFQAWQSVIHYGTAPLRERRLVDFHRLLRFGFVLDGVGALVAVTVAIAGLALFGDRLGWPAAMIPAAMLYATVIAFLVVETPLGVLRLLNRFDLIALQSGFGSLVRLVGASVAFILGGDIFVFLSIWYAASVTSFILLVGFAARELHRHGNLSSPGWTAPGLTAGLPGIWRFAGITNVNSTLTQGSKQITVVIVGAMLGVQEAALFRVAKQVGDALAKPARLLGPVLYPEMARLRSQGKQAKRYRLALQVGVLAGGSATLLLVATALFGAPLLELILGQSFSEAAGIMTWLVAAAAIGIWALPLEPLLISGGRAGRALLVQSVVAAIYLPLLYLLITRFGLPGAGYALVASALMLLLGQVSAVLWEQRSATVRSGAQHCSTFRADV